MRLKSSEAEHYRTVIDNYKLATGLAVIELREAIEWGMTQGHLACSLSDWAAYHLARASEAQREDFATDAQGRKVRLRHSVEVETMDPETGKPVQRHLWGDLNSPDDFLHEAIRQRLARVRADYRAVEADAEFIAASHPALSPRLTQMLLAFDPRAEEEGEASA